MRDKHGAITTFDALGAGTGIGQGTFAITPTRRERSSDTYLMGAVYFTASSWKASKPCRENWEVDPKSTFKERREKNFVQPRCIFRVSIQKAFIRLTRK